MQTGFENPWHDVEQTSHVGARPRQLRRASDAAAVGCSAMSAGRAPSPSIGRRQRHDVTHAVCYCVVVPGGRDTALGSDSRMADRYSFVTRMPSGVKANPLSCFCTRPLETNDINAGL